MTYLMEGIMCKSYLNYIITDFHKNLNVLKVKKIPAHSFTLTLSPPSFYSNFELYLLLFLYHMNC